MIKKILIACLAILVSEPGVADIKNILFGKLYRPNLRGGYRIITNDNENHWKSMSYIENIPAKVRVINLARAECFGLHCIAVGSHESTVGDSPLLISSQNGGETWMQTKYIQGISTKMEYLSGYFGHVVCYGERCFATGLVTDVVADDKSYALIHSEDGGASWSVVPMQQDEDKIESTALYELHCNGIHCVALKSSDGDFMVSHDGGEHWKTVRFRFQGQNLNIKLLGLKQTSKHFIAYGNYEVGHRLAFGFILVSTDSGEHWEPRLDGATINTNNPLYYISQLACNNNTCLAAHAYHKHAQLFLSRDAGLSWQQLSSKDLPPPKTNGITWQKLICSSKACGGIGRFHLTNSSRPLIVSVQLDDPSNEFHYQSQTLHPDMHVNDIHCTSSGCFIAGHYEHHTKEKPHYLKNPPFLLEIDDLFSSWKDISDPSFYLESEDKYHIDALASP